ncbi:collagen alpha-1(XII) chain [Elysia marginata]|uniref:Collagen alpha-1(XII) chain n=1 Tax=Elysia marginata TaxID=1093978 RepID=A0AAV4EI24_9GAST|nr:collagen alpha-1(XII) chain [Elysia marginata]
MELVLVVDSSRSVSDKEFRAMKDFCENLVSRFDISPSKTRVALTLFGHKAFNESFGLDTFTTEAEVVAAIKEVQHVESWGTKTNLGIEHARETQLSKETIRAGVPRVVVVLTDGNSHKARKTKHEALRAAQAGIAMVAVGVGTKVNYYELVNIAAGSWDRVFNVPSFSSLKNIQEPLKDTICGIFSQDPAIKQRYPQMFPSPIKGKQCV